MNARNTRPPLWLRFTIMAITLGTPIIVALQIVLPQFGARTAVIVGFALGIPAVIFVVWKIGWHRWLDE